MRRPGEFGVGLTPPPHRAAAPSYAPLQPTRGAQGPLLRGPAMPRQRAHAADGGDRIVERRLPGEGRGGAAGARGRGGRPRPCCGKGMKGAVEVDLTVSSGPSKRGNTDWGA